MYSIIIIFISHIVNHRQLSCHHVSDVSILQIKKNDVDMKFTEFDRSKDPNYITHCLETMIVKSHISVSKVKLISDASPICQLEVKGITPPLQVDLATNSYDNLSILGTIESQYSNIKTGPVETVAVHAGTYTAPRINYFLL